MTTTLSPHDTGDIPVGDHTRNLAPFLIGRPALRRPPTTGEFPQYVPATIGDVDQPAEPGTKTADIATRLVGQRYRGHHRRREDNSGLYAAGLIWAAGSIAALVMAVIR